MILRLVSFLAYNGDCPHNICKPRFCADQVTKAGKIPLKKQENLFFLNNKKQVDPRKRNFMRWELVSERERNGMCVH
jgi:ribosomal protein S30